MKTKTRRSLLLFIFLSFGIAALAQEHSGDYSESLLREAACTIMGKAHYCALITIDDQGIPRARTMDPFEPDSNFVVWFGTNVNTRKVRQIRENPRVTLYYFERQSESYVILTGMAFLIDEPREKAFYWKKEWKEFYPDYPNDYLLIKVVPEVLEISGTSMGIFSDPKTWRPPSLIFKN
jgi:general stress protein 26